LSSSLIPRRSPGIEMGRIAGKIVFMWSSA
jgi:hypothetical protein